MKYRVSVGYYKSVSDWERSFSYRDEDDDIRVSRRIAEGNNPEDAAKRLFENLVETGGRIIKPKGKETDKWVTGIEKDGYVYKNVDIWTDPKNAECFEVYHFYD